MPTVEEIVQAPPDARAVLIAGPGAGKSHQIGERIAFLSARGIGAEDMLLLTLTNETARTLTGRFPDVPVRTVLNRFDVHN